jgi:hypothetical protein
MREPDQVDEEITAFRRRRAMRLIPRLRLLLARVRIKLGLGLALLGERLCGL